MRKLFFLIGIILLLTGCDFLTSPGGVDEVYKISVNVGPNGTVVPGTMYITKGQDQKFEFLSNPGFLPIAKVDGVLVSSTNSSVLLSNISSNLNLDVVFKEDSLEWPLLHIIWKEDSICIDQNISYIPDGEILNFFTNGKYTVFWKNTLNSLDGWGVDKSKFPAVLTYGKRLCIIEKINKDQLIFSYTNELNQKVTKIYSNHGLK